MTKVLFVCLGNICRSPMAEAIFRHKVNELQLSEAFLADSAGTGNWHTGEAPHTGTRKILNKNNISYDGIYARQIRKQDFDDFDYIIAMDEDNLADIKSLNKGGSNVHINLLSDFIKESAWISVPDPWYTNNFDLTYNLINDGCSKLLQHIQDKNNIREN